MPGNAKAIAVEAAPRAPRRTAAVLALAAIVAVALTLRWWPGCLACDRAHWRQDETNHYPLVCRFLNGGFDVREFKNPTFSDYVVAGAAALVGEARRLFGMDPSFRAFVARETAAPHVALWVGRLVSILASAASVLVVARIGRRLFSASVGGFAAMLLAVDGVAATSAPLCGNESLVVLLGLLAVATALDGGSLRRRLATGLLLGLAVSTKYSAGILVLPIVVAFGVRVWPALLTAALGFVLGSPMALLNFEDFLRGFRTEGGYLHAGYFATDQARRELGFVYYVRTYAEAHAGVVLASLCAVGIVASLALVVLRRERAHALLLAASVPLYLFLGSGIFTSERFLLPAVPFIALHGAWVLERLLTRVAWLRLRPGAALAAGLVAIGGAASWSTMEHQAALGREFGSPEPACVLLAELKPKLASTSRVAELSIPGGFRLLLATDPWAEMTIPAPDDEARRIADDWLAARGLLPTSTSLAGLVLESTSLAELQGKLRSSRIDTLLVDVPTHQLIFGGRIHASAGNERLAACPWWNEFADWLARLPRRAVALSPDRRITAAVLDLDAAPR
jgi:hypothetical protein